MGPDQRIYIHSPWGKEGGRVLVYDRTKDRLEGFLYAVVQPGSMNFNFFNFSSGIQSFRSQISKPSRVTLFADGAYVPRHGNASYYSFAPCHQNRTKFNAVCVDGHVESCRWDFDLLDSQGVNEIWTNWQPDSPRYKVAWADN